MTDHVDSTVDPDGPEVALPAPARPPSDVAREDLAAQLVEEAQANGLALVGPDWLLASLTKRVLEDPIGPFDDVTCRPVAGGVDVVVQQLGTATEQVAADLPEGLPVLGDAADR